ncbi:DUF4198 domain-containing protein [Ideonella sp.]|uniref:DUF4198 domain-containing protein n=1 Tax=Ideonella sp. TaxID=1929293 RepID=UPI0035B08557
MQPLTLQVRTLVAMAAALVSFSAAAHHPWLLPSQTLVDGKEGIVAIDAAATEDLFEFDNRGLSLDGLVITAPDGARVVPTAVNTTSRHRSSFELKLDQPGTYRVANLSQGVMVSYRLGGETRRFRGTAEAWEKERPEKAEDVRVIQFASRVETFVAREKPSDKPFTPTGQGLELIALDAPVDLSDGDHTRFRLLLDGQPLADAALSLLRGGNRYRYKMGELTLKSDAKGEVTVAWPEAGRYWLGVSHSTPAEATNLPPLRRLSYSATLEVRPK